MLNSRIITLLLAISISACGGGGGGGDSDDDEYIDPNVDGSPLAPPPNFEFTGATLTQSGESGSYGILRLQWSSNINEAEEDPAYYQLEGRANKYIDMSVLVDDISSSSSHVDFKVPVHQLIPGDAEGVGYSVIGLDGNGTIFESWTGLLGVDHIASEGLIGYLKANDSATNSLFGLSVAVSEDGKRLAVSAPYDDAGATDSGSVYLFDRGDSHRWLQTQKLDSGSVVANGYFGIAGVFLSGDGRILAVASDRDSTQGFSDTVELFHQDEFSDWKLSDTILVPELQQDIGSVFGVALSNNGQYLAVGTTDSAEIEEVVIYSINDDFTATEISRLEPSVQGDTPLTLYGFGSSLAFSADGSILAVGAPSDRVHPTNPELSGDTEYGSVYIFKNISGSFELAAYLKDSLDPQYGKRFGSNVSLSGGGAVLAVSANHEGGQTPGLEGSPPMESVLENAGAVYVFRESEQDPWSNYSDEVVTGWESYVKSHAPQANDSFGVRLALSGDGNMLVVSTPYSDGAATGVWGDSADQSAPEAGSAHIYHYSNGLWNLGNYVKAANTNAGDRFGSGLALSGDGETLAIGAMCEQSVADGTSGAGQEDNSAECVGAAYLY